MANRLPAWLWGPGQFLRPHQFVGVTRRAACFVWLVAGGIRLSLQRFQLDLCVNANACRNVAGSVGSAAGGTDQRVFVERCVVRSGDCARVKLVFRGAAAVRGERISYVSCECQSAWDTGLRARKEGWRRRSPIARRSWQLRLGFRSLGCCCFILAGDGVLRLRDSSAFLYFVLFYLAIAIPAKTKNCRLKSAISFCAVGRN